MMLVVTIVHVLACAILVLVVLLQAGKGADIGAVFGGASTTIFGSSGAGSFLTRLTTGAAIVFMATSLTLTYGSTRSTSTTIMQESVAPAVPEEPFAGRASGEDAGAEGVAEGESTLSGEAGVEGEAVPPGAAVAPGGGELAPAAQSGQAGGEAAPAPAGGDAASEGAPAEPGPAEPPAAP